MATPVVTVTAGGIAVVEVQNGMPVTEAANACGMAVTKVVGKPYGLPVKFVSATGGAVITGVLQQILSASRAGIGSTLVSTGGGETQLVTGVGVVT